MENLKTVIYKYTVHKSHKLLINEYKVFSNRRPIENYLLSNNEEKLNNLLSEITSDIDIEIYKKEEIDYEVPFVFL